MLTLSPGGCHRSAGANRPQTLAATLTTQATYDSFDSSAKLLRTARPLSWILP
ncbi:hypothetical protein PLANPX_6157 [Lacipirellula parvula]|uniref:Uncharacterized protein n=1 Tax=Lacipirellula parvula TaxID=2650471 RepID=A0A5K7XJI2_9BACT|nr:hypothetical protein PLANPX_6157 [Lacipirellula parvula]